MPPRFLIHRILSVASLDEPAFPFYFPSLISCLLILPWLDVCVYQSLVYLVLAVL